MHLKSSCNGDGEWIWRKYSDMKNKKSLLKFLSEGSCGERGIRTPGTSRYDGFQDRCNRPLYHLSKFGLDDYSLVFLSGCKGTTFFWFHQIFEELFEKKYRKIWEIALKMPLNWRKWHKKRATAVAPTLITLNLILWKTQCKNTKYICSLCIENRKSIFYLWFFTFFKRSPFYFK